MRKKELILTFVLEIVFMLFHIIQLIFDDNKTQWIIWLMADLLFIIPGNIILLKRFK